MNTETIYTRREFSKKFNVSLGTLRNWEKKGIIPHPIRLGRRAYFTEKHLNEIIQAGNSL